MTQQPYVSDRASALDAARLIDEAGGEAAQIAAARADASRDRGNLIHFCRWRQIARLIAVLADPHKEQTRH